MIVDCHAHLVPAELLAEIRKQKTRFLSVRQIEDGGGLAWHLLRPPFPVKTAAVTKARQEAAKRQGAVDSKRLEACAGQYRVASGPTAGDLITIERQAEGLVLKSPATPPHGLQLYAESESRFFLTEADVQVTFETDPQGVTGLVVHFAGTDTAAPRVNPGD